MDISDPLSPGQYVIYTLVDPTDETVYYVGQTRNPKRRLEQHLAARYHEGKKGDWLRCLAQKGQQPLMQIVETITGEQAALEKEQEWIHHFLEKKMPLFNIQAQPSRNPARLHLIPVAELCRTQIIIAGVPPVIAVQLPGGRTGATLRSLCALLDISEGRQAARIKRSPGLASALILATVNTRGGPQQVDVLLDWAIPIWAAGLHLSRLPEARRPVALILQQNAFVAIEQAFASPENDKALSETPQSVLNQIRQEFCC